MILMRLNAKPVNINIIEVHAPTADKDEYELEEFSRQIKEMLRTTKEHEITILMGALTQRWDRKPQMTLLEISV